MYFRFILTIVCFSLSNSFFHPANFPRSLRIYEIDDSQKEARESISEIIDSQKLKFTDKKQEIIDKYQRISGNIQSAPGKISNNIKTVSDSIIYFPSNVTASVELTRSNLQVHR